MFDSGNFWIKSGTNLDKSDEIFPFYPFNYHL